MRLTCTGSEAETEAPTSTPPRTCQLCPSSRVTEVSALPSASASTSTRVPSPAAITSSEVCSNIAVPATSCPTGERKERPHSRVSRTSTAPARRRAGARRPGGARHGDRDARGQLIAAVEVEHCAAVGDADRVVEDDDIADADEVRGEAGGDAVGRVSVAPDRGAGLRGTGDVRLVPVLPVVVGDHRPLRHGRYGDVGEDRVLDFAARGAARHGAGEDVRERRVDLILRQRHVIHLRRGAGGGRGGDREKRQEYGDEGLRSSGRAHAIPLPCGVVACEGRPGGGASDVTEITPRRGFCCYTLQPFHFGLY